MIEIRIYSSCRGLFVKKLKVLALVGLVFFTCFKLEAGTQKRLSKTLKVAACQNNSWKTVQKNSENAVVQVVCHVAEPHPLQPYQKRSREGRGSGFLISNQENRGFILTNYHVVESALQVGVIMPLYFGKKVLQASVVGVCPDYDIALLELDSTATSFLLKDHGSIPFLRLGDSEKVDRSDQLLALGFPLGEESLKSVTGVVSGYAHVTIRNGLRYCGSHAIQVSTPLNPGNSGGPVINEEGFVVGIAMAVADAQAVGYISPINYFMLLASELKKGGLVRKPSLGASFCTAKGDEIAAFLGNPLPAGCYISHVYPGGLAELSGVKEGDMLYRVNGLSIDPYGYVQRNFLKDRLSLADYFASLPLNSSLEVELYRQGERIILHGVLSLTSDSLIRWKYVPYDVIDYEIIGGLLIQELSLNILTFLEEIAKSQNQSLSPRLLLYKEGDKSTESVLVVTHLFPSSVAYNARSYDVGTIIAEVNHCPVTSLKELRELVSGVKKGQNLALTGDQGEFLVLPLLTLLEDEPRLSQSFGYSSTPAMRELMQLK